MGASGDDRGRPPALWILGWVLGWGQQGATRGARFMDFSLEIKLSEAQKNIMEHPKFKTLVARYTFLGSIFDMEQ